MRPCYQWECVLSIKGTGAEESVHYFGKLSVEADRLLPLPSVKTEKSYFKESLLEDGVQLYFLCSLHPQPIITVLSTVQNLSLPAAWKERIQKACIPLLGMCEKETNMEWTLIVCQALNQMLCLFLHLIFKTTHKARNPLTGLGMKKWWFRKGKKL